MSEPVYFKVSCGSCDGHIAFPETSAGMMVACPHCSKDVFLPNPAVIAEPPRFVIEPQNARISDGGYARFTAKAEGVPSPNYQWFSIGSDQTGRPLVGETKPDLVIITPPVGTSQYLVTATNSEGAVQSKIATLTVEQKIILTQAQAPVVLVKPPKPGVDFFGKIDSRETALKIIKVVVVVNILLGLLPTVVLGYVREMSLSSTVSFVICAVATLLLGVFKNRAVAVMLSVLAVVFTGIYSYQCIDDRMMYLAAFLQLLYTIATIRAVEATIKLHGVFANAQSQRSQMPVGAEIAIGAFGAVVTILVLERCGMRFLSF